MAADTSAELVVIYKIVSRDEWNDARRYGTYGGSHDDLRDGYIHLSTRQQLAATAAKHFRGRDELLVVAVHTSDLGDALRWEPSRGGDLFPHLYAPLPVAAARAVVDLPLGPDGVPVIPESIA